MASRKAFLSRNLQDVDAASPDDNDSLVWDSGDGKWKPVAISGGGGGSADFTDLDDTPASYATFSGYYVRVTDTEDALIFDTVPAIGGITTFLELTDVPASFATYSGAFVLVNSTEDALEFSHMVDYIDFNTDWQDGVTEGRLAWDAGDKTLELGMPGGNVKLQIGQEMHIRVKNTSGGNITNGQAVYVSGGDGANPTIALADADIDGAAAIALATENIDDGQFGYVTTNGLVRDVDTDHLVSAGTLVWLSNTPGELQAFPPGGVSRNNVIGMVIRKHASEGILYVASFIFNYIEELSGVTILNPIEDDVLSWNAASGLWINKQGSGGVSTFLGLTDTPSDYSGQEGKVPAVNAGEDGLEFVTVSGGGGGGASILSDTNANEPAAGTEEDLFLPTDGFYIKRDDGAAWQPWGPLFPMVEPVLGDFTWFNQGTATADDTYGGIFMKALAAGGDSHKILKKDTLTPPYTLTVALIPQLFGYNYQQCGIGWRQSSDGKLVTMTIPGYTKGLVVNKWTNETTYNSTYGTILLDNLMQPLIWLRIEDDGANRICSISSNGVFFTPVHSVGRTDYLTADEVFVYVDSNNVTWDAGVLVLSWLLE